jgi:glycosyltransferase involved in cell wall biosynthesis
MRVCAVIPAYDAERHVGAVVRDVLRLWPERDGVFVVDDGSGDATAVVAREAGARVLVHRRNLGKGAALRSGMAAAANAGFDTAVTIDADGQHPAREARRLLEADADPRALLLGVRDLLRDGAPRANRISNRISNFFLSLFSRRALADTQCGLRRYPLPLALALGGRDDGYAFEAEIILRAIAAGVRLVEVPVRVVYPPAGERVTHFDSVRDPARIVVRVVKTLALTAGLRRAPAPAPVPGVTPPPAPRAPAGPEACDGLRADAG